MAKEIKICDNCGSRVNKVYIKCPRCGSHSLIMSTDDKSAKLKKWKICGNCGENVESYYTVCPYCNSTSLTIRQSSELPYFSPLRSVKLSNTPGEVRICPSCGRQIGPEVFKCPFCHNLAYEKLSEIENQNAIVEKKDHALAENIKHILFFRKYEGDVHVFSRSKFLTLLAFVLFFICSIPFSTNLFSSAIIS
ncbi:MAG: hypothetical protein Q4Q14_08440, partial [Methanobrevibacter sp.]|nr:hypothetical protein [Methanobrevibacter sp.]